MEMLEEEAKQYKGLLADKIQLQRNVSRLQEDTASL